MIEIMIFVVVMAIICLMYDMVASRGNKAERRLMAYKNIIKKQDRQVRESRKNKK